MDTITGFVDMDMRRKVDMEQGVGIGMEVGRDID